MDVFKKHPFFFGSLLLVAILFLTSSLYLSYRLKQVKEPVIAFLKSQVNGDVQIEKATAALFPARLRLKNVRLFAPDDKEPSATVEEVDIHFNLFQFFQKEIDTKLDVKKPSLFMRTLAGGKSNFETIFEPMILNAPQKDSGVTGKLLWKRLNVTRLKIREGEFFSDDVKKTTTPDIQGLDIQADGLDFQSARHSSIQMSFYLPKTTPELIKINFNLKRNSDQKTLQVEKGNLFWGAAKMGLTGQMLLPDDQRKTTELALAFSMGAGDLKNFLKTFSKSSSLVGEMSMQGKITGSIFSPVVQFFIDAKKLNLNGKELSNFHAEVSKKGQTIQIDKATFGIYGGSAALSGNLVPGKTTGGNFNVNFRGLSLAAISGKSSPASVSGHLNLKTSNIQSSSFAGGGEIEVGPIPLPRMNFRDKIKGAQLLSAPIFGTPHINFNLLSNSANIIGTQLDRVTANVTFSGNTVHLNSFRFSNGKISGSGSGVIQNQRTIDASGVAVISSGVVAALFPDPAFRSAVTGGKGTLSVPFHVSGSLDNPSFSFDTSFIKNVMGKTIESAIKNIILAPPKVLQHLVKPILKDASPPGFFKHLFGH